MLSLANIKSTAVSALGRGGLILRKHSPEITLGLGIIGTVGSTYLACKATLKIEAINQEKKEQLDKIEKGKQKYDENTYSEEDYKKDLAIVHIQHAIKIGKLYAPAAILGAASIGLILGSHNIMTKRNASLAAAYKLLDEGFKQYRKRVMEEFGPEKEQFLRYNLAEEKVTVTETDSNGNEIVDEKNVITAPVCMGDYSIYAKWFDENSPEWQKSRMHNIYFLQSQQNQANDILHARGHIFLNEVYDMLGIPRTKEGQVVGWLDGHGDSFVDFNLLNPYNEPARDYVNGYNNKAILLDFNVDGVIWNMI